MRVLYTRRSRADLQAILDYIDIRNPQGARNVMRAIQKAIELIGEYPQIGKPAGEQNTRVVPVGRYPYLIYWTIEAIGAWIVHIRHAARRPWNRTP